MKLNYNKIIEKAKKHFEKYGRSEEFVELENKVAATLDAELIYLFALKVEGANIQKLQTAMALTGSWEFARLFAWNVQEADVMYLCGPIM